MTADRFFAFIPGVDIAESNKLHNISVRKLSNCIEILKMYGDDFGFKEEIKYIETELKEVMVLHQIGGFEDIYVCCIQDKMQANIVFLTDG